MVTEIAMISFHAIVVSRTMRAVNVGVLSGRLFDGRSQIDWISNVLNTYIVIMRRGIPERQHVRMFVGQGRRTVPIRGDGYGWSSLQRQVRKEVHQQ